MTSISSGSRAVLVGVLDPQQELAAHVAGRQPVEQRRAGAAQVQVARRRGCETDTCRIAHGAEATPAHSPVGEGARCTVAGRRPAPTMDRLRDEGITWTSTIEDSAAPTTGRPDGGFTPPIDQPPSTVPGRRTALIAVGIVVVLALLAMVAAVGVWPRDATNRPPRPTTDRGPRPRTTKAEPLPGGTVEIATAKDEVTRADGARRRARGLGTGEDLGRARRGAHRSRRAARTSSPPVIALPTDDAPIAGRVRRARRLGVREPRPYEPPQPFTMLVEERRGDWAKVQLPVRPNGTVGWVALADVDLSTTTYRIEINLTDRMLRAYDDTEVIAETRSCRVAVHADPDRQLLRHRHRAADQPRLRPGRTRHRRLQRGHGRVRHRRAGGGAARHQRPGQARHRVSNGCVRLPNDVIEQLADTFPQGTPVYISALSRQRLRAPGDSVSVGVQVEAGCASRRGAAPR